MTEPDIVDYEIERILDERTSHGGRKTFLIKWVGYGDEENTWESREDLKEDGLLPTVVAYEERHKSGRKRSKTPTKQSHTPSASFSKKKKKIAVPSRKETERTTWWKKVIPPLVLMLAALAVASQEGRMIHPGMRLLCVVFPYVVAVYVLVRFEGRDVFASSVALSSLHEASRQVFKLGLPGVITPMPVVVKISTVLRYVFLARAANAEGNVDAKVLVVTLAYWIVAIGGYQKLFDMDVESDLSMFFALLAAIVSLDRLNEKRNLVSVIIALGLLAALADFMFVVPALSDISLLALTAVSFVC